MSDDVKVVLRTVCGCTKAISVPACAKSAIVPYWTEAGETLSREFRYNGEHDRSGKRVFCEVHPWDRQPPPS